MENMIYVLFLLIGLLVGAGSAWMIKNSRAAALKEMLESTGEIETELNSIREKLQVETERRARAEQLSERVPELSAEIEGRNIQIAKFQNEIGELRVKISEFETRLQEERKAANEKIAILDEAREKLSDAFKALSSEALKSNNQSFLELAKSTLEKFQETARGDLEKRQLSISDLIKPVRESLEKFDTRMNDIEKNRVGAYESLTQQVKSLMETQGELRNETGNLVRALRTPSVRGRWGEIQLKRVVELAGMLDHCDFYEQQSVNTEDGRLRPDLIVKLPGNKTIVVDAKTPLESYMDAVNTTDEKIKEKKLDDHARVIRDHVKKLGQKAYWEQFDTTPDFVVLFLPGENFFSAALQKDPGLIESGVDNGIILSTPTTLITLLKVVAYGWRQESLSQNAREISELGKELYRRICTMGEHWERLGSSLDKSVEHYNKAVSSLERRVLVQARKFKELESGSESELRQLDSIDKTTSKLQAEELTEDMEP
ncbi:MAG TPA: DNA recombination protein RmuC [bacterium]|nr:DNA recombination protein RmuC [bacterium]